MITTIIVTNHLNESLTIDLRSPEQSGLAVEYIEGLGPPKAEISLTERANLDGSLFNSSRTTSRNIIISFKYFPNPDIETSRQKTYKYFPIKKEIKLQFVSANRDVYVFGRVESNVANIFSAQSGCVISILCPESYLLDSAESFSTFYSVTPVFEFPFSNESLVTPLIEFSTVILETTKNIIYNGDAQAGMLIHIHAIGAANDVAITNNVTLETISIDSTKLAAFTGSDIISGDDIYISTVNGNKYAKLIRSSVEYNILNCLGTNPVWLKLEKGDNVFAFTADTGLSNLEFLISYDIAFEGI